MVEHFGGELGVLGYPMHGKQTPVTLTEQGKDSHRWVNSSCHSFLTLLLFTLSYNIATWFPALFSIFNGLPDSFQVARYHSLHGLSDKIPSCLDVTALTSDGIVMGIQHKTLPFAAVQFHPESILTSPIHGMTILTNALSFLSNESSDEKEVNGNWN